MGDQVMFLLDYGADANKRNNYGRLAYDSGFALPLICISDRRKSEVLRRLRGRMTTASRDGHTPATTYGTQRLSPEEVWGLRKQKIPEE